MNTILEDIKDGVAKKGFQEEWWLVLQNTVFRPIAGRTAEQQLDEWCRKERLNMEIIYAMDSKKKRQQMVRFTKKQVVNLGGSHAT